MPRPKFARIDDLVKKSAGTKRGPVEDIRLDCQRIGNLEVAVSRDQAFEERPLAFKSGCKLRASQPRDSRQCSLAAAGMLLFHNL